MYSLKLTGFTTKKQAEAFISWYSNQGEQASSYWFEEMKHVGKLDIESICVDSSAPYKWEDDTLVATVKLY